MRRGFLLSALLSISLLSGLRAQVDPSSAWGAVFDSVQVSGLFPDSKTFVDACPDNDPRIIAAQYERASQLCGFNLPHFVDKHFSLPTTPNTSFEGDTSITNHIETLWGHLSRPPDADTCPGGSLIPLPFPYVVPGGRFREVYYWDSYFTLLGLAENGRWQSVAEMVANFAHLIETYGHIPNGNRTYYLSRSQPPVFALMVRLLVSHEGGGAYLRYLPALEKEYAFWMAGHEWVSDTQKAVRRVVRMPNGVLLNRYWDDDPRPRPEAWKEDLHVASDSLQSPEETFRNLRAAAESGWDFSSRWMGGDSLVGRLRTTDYVPIDLNGLLAKLEATLAEAHLVTGDQEGYLEWTARYQSRVSTINEYLWNPNLGAYADYHWPTDTVSNQLTLAAMFPLWLEQAEKGRAQTTANTVLARLERPGGLVTSEVHSGQQWDAPNGWPPLQYVSIIGLRNAGRFDDALRIARKWLSLNDRVFLSSGRMMEKYDVENPNRPAGGGEYLTQDGFGWTNGIYLKLKAEFSAE